MVPLLLAGQFQRQLKAAAAAYSLLLVNAKEPGLRLSAWLGLAECDPAAAWRRLASLPREAPGVGANELTELIGLTAWADPREALAPYDGEPRLSAGGRALLVAARGAAPVTRAGADPAARLATAEALFALADGRFLPSPPPPSALLRGRADAYLNAHRGALRQTAMQVAVALVPDLARGCDLGLLWRRAVAGIREEADAATFGALNDACRTWLSQRPATDSGWMQLLAATTGAVGRRRVAAREAVGVAWAGELVELAARRGVPWSALASGTRELLSYLRHGRAPAEVVNALTGRIAAAYPGGL